MQIKDEYERLKDELQEDAHYLSLKKNSDGSNLYKGAFAPSIKEAAAFGFMVSANATVNQRGFCALPEDYQYVLKKLKVICPF